MIIRLFCCFVVFCCLQGRAQQGNISDNLFLFSGEDPQAKIARNLFCRAEASRNTVVTGQPLVVTLKLYSALESYSVVEKTPGFNGFSTYDITTGKEPYDEVVNGRLYRCHIIRKLQLYPLEAGDFLLDPVEVSNTITFRKIAARSIDEMLGGDAPVTEEKHQYTARTAPVRITVRPLPEKGRPPGFTGAAGMFKLEAACASAETEQFGALRVVYTLLGTGNFKMINALPMEWPAGVEAFDPEIKEEIDENLSPFSGKKVFTYTISASQPGVLELPPVSFCYFNPAGGGYQVTKSQPLRVTVNKAAAAGSISRTDRITDTGTGDKEGAGAGWYLGAGVLALAAAGVFFGFKRKKRRAAEAQPAAVLAEPEPEPEPFDASKRLLALGETGRFFTTLRQELTAEAARVLDLPVIATARDIQQAIVSKELAGRFGALVEELDMALYASATGNRDAAWYLQTAIELVQQMKL